MLQPTVYILIATLILLVFQDFKHRAISWLTIPIVFLCGLVIATYNTSLKEAVVNSLINCSVVLFYLIFLTIYFSIKNRKLVSITNKYLGVGDILFMLAISTVFSTVNFVFFIVGALLLTLITTLAIIYFRKPEKFTIPLAGAMSVILIFLLLFSLYGDFSLYVDSYILSLVTKICPITIT